MTQVFDVVPGRPVEEGRDVPEALFVIRKKAYPAEFREYAAEAAAAASGRRYARATANLPFFLKWKEPFEVRTRRARRSAGGSCSTPFPRTRRSSGRPKGSPASSSSPADEGHAPRLAEEKGFQGLREKEILDFAGLEPDELETAARLLEEEGKARILGFSPLFLLSQESFDFLCRRILEFVGQFHDKHPESRGVDVEKIAKSFELPEIVGQLALKHLLKSGAIQVLDDIVALADFKVPLSTAEEDILAEIEKMCYEGKFSAISLEDVRARFYLSPPRLQTLLGMLAERKKIVQGKDGFYIHSTWLDEIVRKLRERGKRDLSVADFKEMTGLSRKFAIPLLELLDEMGVTKRSGPGRIVL